MVGIIALFVILSVARNFIYPICLAVLLTYLLLPISSYLERIKTPRPIAIILSILIGITLIGGVVFFLYNRTAFFLNDFPALKINAQNNIDTVLNRIESNFGLSVESQKAWLRQSLNDFFETGAGSIRPTREPTGSRWGSSPTPARCSCETSTGFASSPTPSTPTSGRSTSAPGIRPPRPRAPGSTLPWPAD